MSSIKIFTGFYQLQYWQKSKTALTALKRSRNCPRLHNWQTQLATTEPSTIIIFLVLNLHEVHTSHEVSFLCQDARIPPYCF